MTPCNNAPESVDFSSNVWSGAPPLEHECIIEDDGVHPLLEEHSPAYSLSVTQQAFDTWMALGQVNTFKQVCQFYHAIEKAHKSKEIPEVSLADFDDVSSVTSEELDARRTRCVSSSSGVSSASSMTVVPLIAIPLHSTTEPNTCPSTAYHVQWHCCGQSQLIHHCPYAQM